LDFKKKQTQSILLWIELFEVNISLFINARPLAKSIILSLQKNYRISKTQSFCMKIEVFACLIHDNMDNIFINGLKLAHCFPWNACHSTMSLKMDTTFEHKPTRWLLGMVPILHHF